ncbi:amino acid adenylation domain-containing protein, partial [Bacillus pseudomycoides]|nr:amino acid adenylation domain-containing protein [Bacillus pseudomycoides]
MGDGIVTNQINLSEAKRALLKKRLRGKKINKDPIIPKRVHQEAIPLSFAQNRLWFFDQLEKESALYNIPITLHLTGNLDIKVLEQSINEIIRRHEILRTTFDEVENKPVQVINGFQKRSIPCSDLTEYRDEVKKLQMDILIREEACKPFNLKQGPLFRVNLIKINPYEYVLMLNMHHIISDGWSTGIFTKELSKLYEDFSNRRSSSLPELPIQYADFAVWQSEWLQGEVLEKQLSYWKKQLNGDLPILNLPTDRPRPARQTYKGAFIDFALSKDLAEKVRNLSQQEGATEFMTLLAVFKTLIYRYTGQEDILVGSPIANRNYEEIENLIGFFVNTLVIRTPINGSMKFRELLAKVREESLESYSHQDFPFEKLVEVVQPNRDMSTSPIFQVMFVLQNASMKNLEMSGIKIEQLEIHSGTSKFDLTLSMIEEETILSGSIEYNTELFNQDTIEKMIEHFTLLLEGIVENPNQCLSELPLLTDHEQQMLLEWNETETEYPKDKCFHELFEEQVEKTPDAIAVAFEEEKITYRELNNRANQLAHYLQQCGIGTESLVGLYFERSVEMIVGLMGIWKAGAAYVPLDPSYPESRLRYILGDTGIQVLVTNEALEDWIPKEIKVVCLDRDQAMISQESILSPKCEVTGENLAYVIYTSGSTGNPKGALVQHHSVINLSHGLQKEVFAHEIPSNMRVGLNASIAFDASIQQLQMLLYGSSLYIIPNEVRSDPEQFLAYIRENKLEIFDITPSLLQLLIDGGLLKTCDGVHVPSKVLVGGEAIMPSLWEQLVEADKIDFYNVYGPTECTVDATCYHIKKDSKRVTIGRPLPNVQTYVLDRNWLPVPVGVMGELYIGGAGLARGYLNRPELTSERFIPHPFKEGERLYRTGDLVRYLPDGNIDYQGRMDNQVKIRGFRIELGEIESVLGEHQAVQETVVMARIDKETKDKYLVGYVIPKREHELSVLELRNYMKEKLPAYMIPTAFVLIDSFPLNSNGKVDKKLLPESNQTNLELEVTYVGPRSPIEELLVDIWSEILKIKKIGIYD